ncbi:MAG: RNA polymerase sigma factor [Ignavibacteriae bacterium]|nr:RNA polymerase sigma factor [Ignavibacteriota bacterium]MCB9215820.1 RNA polymerase sigma factor [Ignavibacteria bacterium]
MNQPNHKSLKGLSDGALCQMIADEDGNKRGELAFTELYQRYARRIHAYCFRILSSTEDAEDAFQETFLRFHKTVKAGGVMTNVSGLIFTIARNLCINLKKKNTRWASDDIDDHTISSYDSTYDQKELLNLVKTSLELINPDYREAFVLREYNGFSYDEIARMLDVSVPTAKIRVFRAKEKIRKVLEPYLKDLLSI